MPERLDLNFLDRVIVRIAREREAKSRALKVVYGPSRVCPVCYLPMPRSSGAEICGRHPTPKKRKVIP